MASSSWDDIRKAARSLENEIDYKLVSISKVSSSTTSADSVPLLSDHVFDNLALEMEQMLDKLSDINEKMTDLATTGATTTHTLQRHRDILHEYKQEFNKLRSIHTTRIEREELLKGSGVMNNSLSGGGGGLNRRDMYMKETGHLHNSNSLINDQINIAIETREHLTSQRQYLKRVQTRFNDMTHRFPLISSLIQRINLKKRRDSLIVGGTIGFCLFLLIWYTFQ